jgi:peptidyl-prolyl cis-trans isomerase B (cyclophilin B)
VASSKDRQRKLAREKFDRQQARRASKQRRRRQISAGVGAALALVVIVGGIAWMGGFFDKTEEEQAADSDICLWTPQNAETNKDLKEVGTPPTKGIATSGTRPLTITTDKGEPIVVTMDLATAPCGGESLAYLAGKQFFDNTTCHEITTEGAIRCGDPSGTGQGGPTYSVYNEDLPAAQPSASPSSGTKATPVYPKGTVAFIGDPPGTNGSQFLIFYKDFTPKADPAYSIIGTVTAGLDTVEKIGKIATVANATGDKVTPKDKITVKSITVGEVAPAGDSPAGAPSASSQS